MRLALSSFSMATWLSKGCSIFYLEQPIGLAKSQCCAAGGAIIELPPGAEAVIANYRFRSLLFYKGLKKFYRKKIMVAKKWKSDHSFNFIFLFLLKVKTNNFSAKHDIGSCRSWIRSRSRNSWYCSAEPEPKDIYFRLRTTVKSTEIVKMGNKGD